MSDKKGFDTSRLEDLMRRVDEATRPAALVPVVEKPVEIVVEKPVTVYRDRQVPVSVYRDPPNYAPLSWLGVSLLVLGLGFGVVKGCSAFREGRAASRFYSYQNEYALIRADVTNGDFETANRRSDRLIMRMSKDSYPGVSTLLEEILTFDNSTINPGLDTQKAQRSEELGRQAENQGKQRLIVYQHTFDKIKSLVSNNDYVQAEKLAEDLRSRMSSDSYPGIKILFDQVVSYDEGTIQEYLAKEKADEGIKSVLDEPKEKSDNKSPQVPSSDSRVPTKETTSSSVQEKPPENPIRVVSEEKPSSKPPHITNEPSIDQRLSSATYKIVMDGISIVQNIDGSEHVVATNPYFSSSSNTFFGPYIGDFSVSPDKSRLVFTFDGRVKTYSIYFTDLRSESVKGLVHSRNRIDGDVPIEDYHIDSNPRWDGDNSIIFTRNYYLKDQRAGSYDVHAELTSFGGLERMLKIK